MALAPNVNGAGKVGHVGWVVSVETQTVVVQEYDFLVRFGYDERDFPIAGAQFIHLPQPPHPTPEPTPIPNPATEDDMQPVIVNVNAAIGSYLLFPNGEYVGIASGPDLTAFASLGYKQITVSPTQHQRLVAAAPNNAGANA
jgi:hypothetical protein